MLLHKAPDILQSGTAHLLVKRIRHRYNICILFCNFPTQVILYRILFLTILHDPLSCRLRLLICNSQFPTQGGVGCSNCIVISWLLSCILSVRSDSRINYPWRINVNEYSYIWVEWNVQRTCWRVTADWLGSARWLLAYSKATTFVEVTTTNARTLEEVKWARV